VPDPPGAWAISAARIQPGIEGDWRKVICPLSLACRALSKGASPPPAHDIVHDVTVAQLVAAFVTGDSDDAALRFRGALRVTGTVDIALGPANMRRQLGKSGAVVTFVPVPVESGELRSATVLCRFWDSDRAAEDGRTLPGAVVTVEGVFDKVKIESDARSGKAGIWLTQCRLVPR
jgi:hypothetical protein